VTSTALRVQIQTDQRYGTHNGLPVPGTLMKDRDRLDYRYDDGTHQLTIWGPYTNAEADLNTETDDASDIIKYLVGYPGNAEVQALIDWLESGCDPTSFPGSVGGTSAEQQARDLLEQYGLEDAQSMTAGDLVELANLIGDAHAYRRMHDPPTSG
jgi:hypothetical protein